MNIFGFFIPWWVLVSVFFGALYVLFTILGKRKVAKIKAKRNNENAINN